MESEPQVAYCPHCENYAPQRLLYIYDYYEPIEEVTGQRYPTCAFLFACNTCDGPLLYLSPTFGASPEFVFEDLNLRYPEPEKLHEAVPVLIRKLYEEATQIKYRSPTAFAVLIGRCMEAICMDKGAEGQTLVKKLKDLALKGLIPPVFATYTDVLRTLRNAAAHHGSVELNWSTSNVINDFFKAIVEYLYVAEAKLRQFEKTREGMRSNPSF